MIFGRLEFVIISFPLISRLWIRALMSNSVLIIADSSLVRMSPGSLWCHFTISGGLLVALAA